MSAPTRGINASSLITCMELTPVFTDVLTVKISLSCPGIISYGELSAFRTVTGISTVYPRAMEMFISSSTENSAIIYTPTVTLSGSIVATSL